MKAIAIRYWKLLLVALFVIAAGIFWVTRASAQKAQPAITTAKVVQKNFVKTISSSGKTKADKSVDLKFQTSGKLTWVGVKEGDRVNAYQAIANLDSREVQKNLEKALRDYSNERNDFEEAGQITYGIRKTDTVNNLLNDTVKRILQKNQWDLEKAVLDVELKHLSLEYASLVTPIAGIVTHVDTPVSGVNITPATAVFTVVDPTTIMFEANIDEIDIGGVSVGQPARISLDAFPDRTIEGTVSAIAYSAETSTGGATVFPVRILLPGIDALRVGFNGDVMIEVDKRPQALVVPISAVREKDGAKYVYLKTSTSYKKMAVTTGVSSDDEVTITEGLQPDDEVVTKGFNTIPGSSL